MIQRLMSFHEINPLQTMTACLKEVMNKHAYKQRFFFVDLMLVDC